MINLSVAACLPFSRRSIPLIPFTFLIIPPRLFFLFLYLCDLSNRLSLLQLAISFSCIVVTSARASGVTVVRDQMSTIRKWILGDPAPACEAAREDLKYCLLESECVKKVGYLFKFYIFYCLRKRGKEYIAMLVSACHWYVVESIDLLVYLRSPRFNSAEIVHSYYSTC